MDERDEPTDPYARGFAVSRRELLRTSAAVGSAGALAGCPGDLGLGTDTPEQTTADAGTTASGSTPPGSPGGPGGTATSRSTARAPADGLRIVSTGIVQSGQRRRHLRVALRNDLQDETMSMVTVMAQFFDPDLGFLGVRTPTLSYFGPGERFEGYVPVVHDETAAYAVEATRTARDHGRRPARGLTVRGECLADERVHGTIENDGSGDAGRTDVRVTFFDDDGHRLGSGIDTIDGLAAGESTTFAVDLENAVGDPAVKPTDYSISVGTFGRARLSVR